MLVAEFNYYSHSLYFQHRQQPLVLMAIKQLVLADRLLEGTPAGEAVHEILGDVQNKPLILQYVSVWSYFARSVQQKNHNFYYDHGNYQDGSYAIAISNDLFTYPEHTT